MGKAVAMKRILVLGLVVAIILSATTVFAANESTGLAIKKEETGLHLGAMIVHPNLSLSTAYDTNVFNSADNEVSDVSLDVNSGLLINMPSPVFAFTLNGEVGYKKYFGTDNESSKNLDNLFGKVRLSLLFFKKSVVSFGLSDTFIRTSLPEGVTVFDVQKRFVNTAGAFILLRPNGPKGTLKVRFTYRNLWQRYDDDKFRNNNFLKHYMELESEWSFLPKTTVFFVANYSIIDYYDFSTSISPIYTNAPNASPLEVRLGLFGRLTAFLDMNLSLGYSNSFSETLSNYQSVAVKSELTFAPFRRTRIKLGFERNSAHVNVFGYAVNNKPYLSLQQWMFSDRLKLSAFFSYNYQMFGEPDSSIDTSQVSGMGERTDSLMTAKASVEVVATSWFTVSLSYLFQMKDSSLDSLIVQGTPVKYDFMKHRAMLNLVFSY